MKAAIKHLHRHTAMWICSRHVGSLKNECKSTDLSQKPRRDTSAHDVDFLFYRSKRCRNSALYVSQQFLIYQESFQWYFSRTLHITTSEIQSSINMPATQNQMGIQPIPSDSHSQPISSKPVGTTRVKIPDLFASILASTPTGNANYLAVKMEAETWFSKFVTCSNATNTH